MTVYSHILFASDLSELSHKAGKQVAKLAAAFGAKLSLVHVIEPIPAYGYPGVTELQSPHIDDIKEEVETMAKEIKVKEADVYVEVGSVKHEVFRLAKELKVDLIVIGSHGHHGLSRLLGSTASAVIHGAECDVLTIRVEE